MLGLRRSAFLVEVAFLVLYEGVWACTPLPEGAEWDLIDTQRIRSEYQLADRAVVAKIETEAPRAISMNGRYVDSGRVAVVSVQAGWKGFTEEHLRLEYSDLGRCPPQNEPLEVGKSYLLFLDRGRLSKWYRVDDIAGFVEPLGSPYFEYVRDRIYYRQTQK